MDKYEFVSELGSGHYGIVKLYKNKITGKQEAIKFIPRGKAITMHVLWEIGHLILVDHPMVIGFNEAFLTQDHLCISMEHANSGDLFSVLVNNGPLTESEAHYFFAQVVTALATCHEQEVVHRDIKLENVLLVTDETGMTTAKLCDFGMSKHHLACHKSVIGTPAYMAPEIFDKKNEKGYDGTKTDVWACGVLLYLMLFGKYPFEDDLRPLDLKLTIRNIRRGLFYFPKSEGAYDTSDTVRDLISKMLTTSTTDRITVKGVMDHPWFKGYKTVCVETLPKYPRSVQTMDDIYKIFEEAKTDGFSFTGTHKKLKTTDGCIKVAPPVFGTMVTA